MTPRSWGSVLIVLAVAAVLLAADLGSKAWAVENLSLGRFSTEIDVCQPDESGYTTMVRIAKAPKVIIENFFELRYAENCGAAFGVLNSTKSIWKDVLFFGAALGAVGALLFSYRRGNGGIWFVIAVPAIVSGALGNFADRVRYGYVVDFIRFYYRGWEYPTFNIADVAITVGVVALLVDGILDARREMVEKRLASAPAQPEATPPADTDDSSQSKA